MAERRTGRRFTAEFKSEAVQRLLEGGRDLSDVATELGLSPGQLGAWRNAHLSTGPLVPGRRRGYGSPTVHAERGREGRPPSRRRVERLMREMGLAARRGRRRAPRTTDSRHDLPVAPNLLDRNFAAERPDAVWLADLSYLPTDEGWLYLAVIEDLATREIVGWSMADHLRADLCRDALV